ncbi:MAG: S1 RNA-binding domain-containing protein, partial [Bacteroidia bacterium]|nr:S1 RNA-binding domain-containing protein [Bacteroidia bacterium]
MVEIGKFNILRVIKKVDFGIYLDGKQLGELLMPRRYVPAGCEIGG